MSKDQISKSDSVNVSLEPSELDGMDDVMELDPEALDEVEVEDVESLDASDDIEEIDDEDALEVVSEPEGDLPEEDLEVGAQGVGADRLESATTKTTDNAATESRESLPPKLSEAPSREPPSVPNPPALSGNVTPSSGVSLENEWFDHALFGYAPFDVRLPSVEVTQSVAFTPIPQKSPQR